MKKKPLLSKYEELVFNAIHEIVTPFDDRVAVKLDSNEDGNSWEIIPKNTNAAKMYIYGVEKNTIHITVDEKYWLEMFIKENEYKKGLPYFRGHIVAIINGRARGWYLKDERLEQDPRWKTLLEIDVASNKSYRWSGNILFTKKFKKQKDVIVQNFESY